MEGQRRDFLEAEEEEEEFQSLFFDFGIWFKLKYDDIFLPHSQVLSARSDLGRFYSLHTRSATQHVTSVHELFHFM